MREIFKVKLMIIPMHNNYVCLHDHAWSLCMINFVKINKSKILDMKEGDISLIIFLRKNISFSHVYLT